MLPKIQSALDAAKNGVNTVHIIDGRVPHAMLLEVLTEQAYGTDDPLALKRRSPRRSGCSISTTRCTTRASAAFGEMHVAIGDYVVRHLGITAEEADALRQRYWLRYGATLLGLVRHHGVRAAHFLEETHRMPGLEARAARQRPRPRRARAAAGAQVILTNAPRAYAMRVLDTLGLTQPLRRR